MEEFLIGGALGFSSAVIGALVQYRIHSHSESGEPPDRLPGCILLVTGMLGFLGLVMLATSVFMTGTIWLALVPGIGVVTGFAAGFIFMFWLWTRVEAGAERRRQEAAEPTSTSAESAGAALKLWGQSKRTPAHQSAPDNPVQGPSSK